MRGSAVSNGTSAETEQASAALQGISRDDLLRAYRTMVLSRRLDDKEIQLKGQSLIFFQISGAGHEAILTAAGMLLKPAYDWFYPYYRDRALCLALGVTAVRHAARGRRIEGRSRLRRAADAVTLVRSIAEHRLGLEPHRHPVPAGDRLRRGGPALRAGPRDPGREGHFAPDEITYVSLGEGATSEGEFWESLNAACLTRLPVIFLVEDNGYAISVPVDVQTAGGDISKLVASFPDLLVRSIDGTDFPTCYRTMQEAVEYVRSRRGPAFVHAHVTRPYSHSLSDDERFYKTPEERAAEALRDPIVRLGELLTAADVASDAELKAIAADVDREVNEAADRALAAEKPSIRHGRTVRLLARHRPDLRRVRRGGGARGQAGHDGRGDQSHAQRRDGAQPAHRRVRRGRRRLQPARGPGLRVRQGRRVQGHPRPAARVRRRSRLQLAARRSGDRRARHRHGDPRHQAGRRDPVLRLHLAGDDADARRDVDAALSLEQRLLMPDGDPRGDRRLPARRRAVPQPVRREHLRALPGDSRLRSRRTPRTRPACCGPLSAATTRSSFSSTSISTARPTTRARILARTSPCRSGSRPSAAKAATSWSSPTARWSSARCSLRSRRRRTASARWSSTCARSPRSTGTASPTAVKRTSRVVIAHEDQLTCGFGAELAARISEHLFEHLDAPVKRVAAKDVPVAYYPDLEEAILPQAGDVLKAIRDVARY